MSCSSVYCVGTCVRIMQARTARHGCLVLDAALVRGNGGGIVGHPDLAVVAPMHIDAFVFLWCMVKRECACTSNARLSLCEMPRVGWQGRCWVVVVASCQVLIPMCVLLLVVLEWRYLQDLHACLINTKKLALFAIINLTHHCALSIPTTHWYPAQHAVWRIIDHQKRASCTPQPMPPAKPPHP